MLHDAVSNQIRISKAARVEAIGMLPCSRSVLMTVSPFSLKPLFSHTLPCIHPPRLSLAFSPLFVSSYMPSFLPRRFFVVHVLTIYHVYRRLQRMVPSPVHSFHACMHSQAFDHLIGTNVFVPCPVPASSNPGREFMKYRCMVEWDDVKRAVDAKGQTNLKKWFTKPT